MVSQAISHYRIIKKLGAGGMGEVYLAEDIKLGRKVAIKFLPTTSAGDEQAIKRLIREARAAAKLDHPNICAIYEVGEEADSHFIVMQYVEGETLSRKLKHKDLQLPESIDVAIDVADALSAAHSQGIIHRDIKPQNVIITPRGQAKVLDFGLAKTIQQGQVVETEAETQSMITQAGVLIGTVPYMSPEQARGAQLDARSDLFSLGTMLYECVTSKAAFSGSSLMEVCGQVIYVDPQLPSSIDPRVPQELDAIILRALAKNADDRYQSASEMLADLKRVRGALRDNSQSGEPLLSGPEAMRPTGPNFLLRIVRRRDLVKAGLLIGSLLVILATWVGLRVWPRVIHQPIPEARRWYDAAVNNLRDGAYYQATRALERAIEIDDRFALAHAGLAEALIELDYGDRAKDELLLASSLVPNRAALPQADSLYLDAITAMTRRDFTKAIEYSQRIAERATDSEKPSAYLDLGRAYEKNEEVDKAIENYLEASRRDPQYAAAFLRLGILYGRKQSLKDANLAFDEAQSLYQAKSNLEGVAETLYQRGYIFNQLDKVAEARAHLERALAIAQTTANKFQQIRTLLQLSSVSWTEGNTERARQYATEAIELAQTENLENLATAGLIDMGTALFIRGDYVEAEKYFRQAIEVAQRYKGRRHEAKAFLSLGSLHIQRGNTDEGIPYVKQALAFYQQGVYRKEMSLCFTLLGRANRQKGDYTAALQAFEQQLQLSNDVGDQSQMASSHTSIGTLLGYYQERYSKALAHFEESYKINESLGAKLGMGYDLMNRGAMLWQLGRYGEAQALLTLAASIADRPEASYKHLLAWMHLTNARMSLSRQRLSEAKTECQKAIDLAGSQYKDVAVQAKYTRGLAQLLSGAPKAGKLLCDEAVAMANSLGNPRWLSNALLTQSEAILKTGDTQNALATALKTQESSARSGQQDSEWHAWLIAARASYMAGDVASAHAYASRAASLLSNLQQEFGPEFYKSFSLRPDVQANRKKLDQILATG